MRKQKRASHGYDSYNNQKFSWVEMKFSIVTPSYNQGHFIEKTLQSVLKQEGDFDLEYLVVDGGSSDNTIDILKQTEKTIYSKSFKLKCNSLSFQWITEKDKGQADALNKGFSLSTGQLLGWLNSDDIYLRPDSLSIAYKAFVQSSADIVVGNARYINEYNQTLNTPILINRLDNNQFQIRLSTLYKYDFIVQPSSFFKRSVWETCGIKTEYHYVMDWVFWIDAFSIGKTFYKIDDCLAASRIHESAKTVEGGFQKYLEGISVFKTYNTWCLNRWFYSIFKILLGFKTFPYMEKHMTSCISVGKKIRNSIINKLRMY